MGRGLRGWLRGPRPRPYDDVCPPLEAGPVLPTGQHLFPNPVWFLGSFLSKLAHRVQYEQQGSCRRQKLLFDPVSRPKAAGTQEPRWGLP